MFAKSEQAAYLCKKKLCIMKTKSNISAYEQFCRLMTEESLYTDLSLTFATVCRWLEASEAELDRLIEQELGYSGEALMQHLRTQQAIRLRDTYGIVR